FAFSKSREEPESCPEFKSSLFAELLSCCSKTSSEMLESLRRRLYFCSSNVYSRISLFSLSAVVSESTSSASSFLLKSSTSTLSRLFSFCNLTRITFSAEKDEEGGREGGEPRDFFSNHQASPIATIVPALLLGSSVFFESANIVTYYPSDHLLIIHPTHTR